MGDHRKLRAWREAMRLVVLSGRAIERLPPCERYVLADQWRRAAYSVPLNIAEGASRRGPREFRRFLDMARASLHELETITEIAVAQRYLTDADVAAVRQSRDACVRMVYGLLRRMAELT